MMILLPDEDLSTLEEKVIITQKSIFPIAKWSR